MDLETIVDAGPLIGWFSARDQWHDWSVATLAPRRLPLHTTEIVVGEACWHLGGNTPAVHALLDHVRAGNVMLVHLWPEALAATQQLMLRYDRMDAADASLVTLAEMCPKATLITTDRRDFVNCRGLRNRPLRLILPE